MPRCTSRWSSTYIMLDAYTLYKEALNEYAQSDPNYEWQPNDDDLVLYGKIQPLLKSFDEDNHYTIGIYLPHYQHFLSIYHEC